MNATFFLLATAWLPGADPAAAGIPPGPLPATAVAPAPCDPNGPPDEGAGNFKPTLKDRIAAFRNPLGVLPTGNDCGTLDSARPTLKDRIAAFRHPPGMCPSPSGPATVSVVCVRAANPIHNVPVAAPPQPNPNGLVPVAVTQVVPLDDLAQRIAQQEHQLDALRREYEARQEQLANLTRRREQLESQLRQLDQEIATLAHGATLPSVLPAANAAPANQWPK